MHMVPARLGFQERFQDFRKGFVEISRFHVTFLDFQKDYARFLARFQILQNFQISMKIFARFPGSSADFDILILNFKMM